MAYNEHPETQEGIKKEKFHFPIVANFFKSQGSELIESTPYENMVLKVDWWGLKPDKEYRWPFDFKTSGESWNGFSLTYKINGDTRHEFEVGIPAITSIFLVEEDDEFYQYFFVKKALIYQWFLENKPYVGPSKNNNDDSTFFYFTTPTVKKLAIKSIKIPK